MTFVLFSIIVRGAEVICKVMVQYPQIIGEQRIADVVVHQTYIDDIIDESQYGFEVGFLIVADTMKSPRHIR